MNTQIDSKVTIHEHAELHSKTIFGFWVYLMTDCMLFGALFATYAVLHNNTHGGATSKNLFDINYVLFETLALLTSSFTCGIALIHTQNVDKLKTLLWIFLTFIFGSVFLGLELNEFIQFVREGHSWERSAFLSAFFTLVGTHGAHITVGLIWMIVMVGQIMKLGMTPSVLRRMTCFSLFWHFLDVIWIFIFTIVYLLGV